MEQGNNQQKPPVRRRYHPPVTPAEHTQTIAEPTPSASISKPVQHQQNPYPHTPPPVQQQPAAQHNAVPPFQVPQKPYADPYTKVPAEKPVTPSAASLSAQPKDPPYPYSNQMPMGSPYGYPSNPQAVPVSRRAANPEARPAPAYPEKPKAEPAPAFPEKPKAEHAPVFPERPKAEPAPAPSAKPKNEPAPVFPVKPKAEPAPSAKPEKKPFSIDAAADQPKKRRASAPVQPPVQKQPEVFSYPSQYSSQNTTNAKQKPAGTLKPITKKQMLHYLGIALCALVLIVSATMLIRYYSQIRQANNASDQLRALYNNASTEQPDAVTTEPVAAATAATTVPPSQPPVTPEPTAQQPEAVTPTPQPAVTMDASTFLAKWPSKYPGNEQMRIQERFTPLRQQNRDVVAWLTIDGVVDEPVFQRDNSYYLSHDATGKQNPTGALFLDENCNLRSVPMQTLIHGHNMKEGAMFGSLKKYKVKDASFYREHPFIKLDTLYESATYVIFAVAEVNIVPGNMHYFPFWHRFQFSDYETFHDYVSLAKEYSRFKVDIDVQPGDRLLTLATCSSGDDNLRLIVMARMLRENEDSIMLTNKIYSATAK